MKFIHDNEIVEALGYMRDIKQPKDFSAWTLGSFECLLYGFVELVKAEEEELSDRQNELLHSQEDISLIKETVKIYQQCNFFELLGGHSGMAYPEKSTTLSNEFNQALNKQRQHRPTGWTR